MLRLIRYLAGMVLASQVSFCIPFTIEAVFDEDVLAQGIQRTVGDAAGWVDTTTGIFRFRRIGGDYPGFPGPVFYAFCIEPREFVSTGQTYVYDWSPLEEGTTNIGGMGEDKANLLRELFARYYRVFGAPLDATQAGALQIAVWEIVRETSGTLDPYQGTTRFQNPANQAALDLAAAYLESLTGTGPRLDSLFALIRVGVQDLVVQETPEPAFGGLVGLLLIAVPLWARRRPA